MKTLGADRKIWWGGEFDGTTGYALLVEDYVFWNWETVVDNAVADQREFTGLEFLQFQQTSLFAVKLIVSLVAMSCGIVCVIIRVV